MTEPRRSVILLVQAAARAERGDGDGVRDSDVAQRILTKLHRDIGKVLGSLAFDVMLGRSLALARRAHPVLTGVTVGPDGALSGLDGAAGGDAMAIVAQFIELLIVLIGEDLAMLLVRDALPGATEEKKR
jgi:hypothetical protein